MQGFINVYKKSGVTSSQVVGQIKHKLKLKKVGHMGTLDPMAQGVLPIAVGKATRMFDYFLFKEKAYLVEMKFGSETDTLDSTGVVVCKDQKIPEFSDIKTVVNSFLGNIKQVPPKYSAKNINGMRAYTLARQGKDFELKACDVTIYSINIISYIDGVLKFECKCSGGTYIRSLVRDIAYALGTVATMTYLCRTSCGCFNVDTAIDIDNPCDFESNIIPIEGVFSHIKVIDLPDNKVDRLLNGLTQKVDVDNGLYFIKKGNQLLAVVQVENAVCKMKTYLKEDCFD